MNSKCVFKNVSGRTFSTSQEGINVEYNVETFNYCGNIAFELFGNF